MMRAVIFDCDGVIINSEPMRHKSYQELFCKEFSAKIPDKRDICTFGKTESDNLTYYLKKCRLKGNVKELSKKRALILKRMLGKKKNIKPVKGLFRFIDLLKKNNYKIAVASSSHKKYLKIILNSLKIYKKFNVIVSAEMVKKGKPNPEIFLQAAKKLNMEPKKCVVIEDAVNGIVAAKRAKIKCIALTTSLPRNMLKKADLIAGSFKGINLKKIERL